MPRTAERPLTRLVLALLGLLAGSTLVWYVGPLVAVAGVVPLADERARWIAIAVLAASAVASSAWRAAGAARGNRRLMEGMVAPEAGTPRRRAGDVKPEPPAGAREMAQLEERFERAVGMLKHRRIGGRHPLVGALTGRPYVYELPWYIIIGAPGAGKTTALANSGLDFPLAARVGRKVIRGVGGTRNCDWWFTSEAVLIDTAGRYTTHDSHLATDRAAWFGFLDLLARYRPGRPINGVLLTVSVSDLLTAGAEQRALHARALRERVQELHERLGIRFPVYVLVTKTDLLAGFMEFFADFDKEERAQVWGVTFPHGTQADAEAPLARMASDFAALEKRLNECLIDRLRSEQDRDRRAAIYAFPQQWRALRETLADFLHAAFPGAPGESQPLLRGVYFTSATQEGTPIDRAIGELARALGLTGRIVAPSRPSGKTFFVTRLLRDVVLAEAGLAGTNLRWRRRRAWLATGLSVATAFAAAAAAALMWAAYEDDRNRLVAAGERVAALERGTAAARNAAATDLAALLPPLQALGALQAGAPAQPPQPRPAMGLDHADTLAAAAQDAYRRLLKDAFLPRIAARLEERLRAGSPEHVTRLYEDLKAYLMLFGGKNFDKAALRSFLWADWEASLPAAVSAVDREALRRHLDQLLAGGEVGAPSQAEPQLVAQARKLVAGVPLAQRAYDRLKQLDFESEAPTATVLSAGGANARRVFVRASGQSLDRGVPGLYSRAVLQQSLRKHVRDVLGELAAEQGWVLGQPAGSSDAAQAQLVEQVERLYVADYVRRWDEFVGDLRLIPPPTLAASAEAAQVLSHADSPLTALVRTVVREVTAGPTGGTDAALIDPRFEPLQRFAAGQPSALDDTLAQLGRLSAHLSAVADALKRQAALPSSDVTREIEAAAQRAPEPLHVMLTTLARRSAGQVFAAAQAPLARQMADELFAQCSRAIAGRYPFDRSGRQEMPRDEFARVFAAGGIVDGFFQRRLAPYVDTSVHPWVYRKADGTAGESTDALRQFQRAQAVREAWFRDGARTPGLRLELSPLEMDPGITQFALDVDGRGVLFTHESKGTQELLWPGATGAGRVQLRLTPVAGGSGSSYAFEGAWSLLRLLDRVRVEPGAAPDRVRLLFDVEGHRMRFEVRGAAALSPVFRQELEQFQCPKHP